MAPSTRLERVLMSNVAYLVLSSYAQTWGWPGLMGATLLGWMASTVLSPPLARRPTLTLTGFLLLGTLGAYSLLFRPHHNPLVEAALVIATVVMWRALFEDQWPGLRRRAARLAALIRTLARPVMARPS